MVNCEKSVCHISQLHIDFTVLMFQLVLFSLAPHPSLLFSWLNDAFNFLSLKLFIHEPRCHETRCHAITRSSGSHWLNRVVAMAKRGADCMTDARGIGRCYCPELVFFSWVLDLHVRVVRVHCTVCWAQEMVISAQLLSRCGWVCLGSIHTEWLNVASQIALPKSWCRMLGYY